MEIVEHYIEFTENWVKNKIWIVFLSYAVNNMKKIMLFIVPTNRVEFVTVILV
jgi:hypothetical protein